MAGALRGTAGDRALPQPRGGPVRPAAAHPLRRQGHVGGLRRAGGPLDGRGQPRHRGPGAVLRRRHRRPLGAVLPGRAGAGGLRGRVVPHRVVAGGAGRFHRQAGRRDRHRIERRADHPRHRREGRRPDGLPTLRQLVHAAQQRADHTRTAGAAQDGLRADPPDAGHVTERVPPPGQRAGHLRRLGGGALGVLRGDVAQPGLLEAHQQLQRSLVRPGRERGVVRLPGRQDPRHRQGPRDGGEADPRGPSVRREAAAVRHRLLRGLQRAARGPRRSPGDADRAGHRERDRDRRRSPGIRHHRVGHRDSTSARVR